MIRTSAVLCTIVAFIACGGGTNSDGATITDTAPTDAVASDTGTTLPPGPPTDIGPNPTDTAEPPTTDVIEPPKPDITDPTDAVTPTDTAQPPTPDTTEADTTKPDIQEPPKPDTTDPPKPDIAEPADTVEPPKPDTAEPLDATEPDTAEPPKPAEITWTSHIQSIITSRCAPCHTTQSKGQLKIKSYATMLEPSPKCYAGLNVAESIKLKVQPNPGCKNVMPPAGKLPLTDKQIQQIIDWVDAGYPE